MCALVPGVQTGPLPILRLPQPPGRDCGRERLTRKEIVSRAYATFNAGDVEGSLAFLHPEIEWNTYIVPGPGGGVYHGHDGVRELWSDAKKENGIATRRERV